jgi:nicotinate-nucleotide adenylyltransferase
MATPRKIALFGGTFDPVHLGHIHLAILAKNALSLDQVRFLPCRVSPHKTGSHPTSGEHRLEMLKLATAHLRWAFVDDYELKSEQPSFSYQTAQVMAKRFPNDRLFWIMGGDQWDALPRWAHPEILAKTVEFIVLARGEKPVPREGYRLHIVPGTHPGSATAIREATLAGSTAPLWLDPAVADWIRKHRLYQNAAD